MALEYGAALHACPSHSGTHQVIYEAVAWYLLTKSVWAVRRSFIIIHVMHNEPLERLIAMVTTLDTIWR